MSKLIVFLISALFFLINTYQVFAAPDSFVSIVNPVRGDDFWDSKDQIPSTVVNGQLKILNQFNIQPSWLLRYDALNILEITATLKENRGERGLFLEITPTWAGEARVNYKTSESWHLAGSAFLTGYEREERVKLIDKAFEKFKEIFGGYPTSVGSWWIDSYSLEYMEKKYGITSALIVSDQYTTDNYQIWGQFWSTPYYPSRRNALEPARNVEDKLQVVLVQWAPRDPLNAYGNGVQESTYSVQANDYLTYHNLTTDYFSKLVDIYTNQKFNKFGHLVVGLENSYDWEKYKDEYKRQIEVLVKKRNDGQLSIVPMKDFADWYRRNFQFSPPHLIEASDPLGTGQKIVWFMNLNYRAGWFYNGDGSVFRDIHQYRGGEELCYLKRCDEMSFATSATRVLDEVSFGHKWIIDEGVIKDFKVTKRGESYVLSYINQAGNQRIIELLDRDIGVDGKTSSIDATILNATEHSLDKEKLQIQIEKGPIRWSLQSVIFKLIKFIIFLIILTSIPYLLINKIYRETLSLQKIFLATTLGLVLFTLTFYTLSLLGLRQLIYGYIFINIIIITTFIVRLKSGSWKNLSSLFKHKLNLPISVLILAGTIFQVIPTFKNALNYSYGLGFWGPNTHDGVWHISLINQLIKSVPPQNPIFAPDTLKNYHYFYDLLIAGTISIVKIPVVDLVFRFYPLLFSLLLGVGTIYLIKVLFDTKLTDLQLKIATFFGLYLVYFAGSFGWIVDYIKGKGLGGESNFWANQSISFNLNPPFAISVIIIIAILQILLRVDRLNRWSLVTLTILCGSLIAFKAYGGFLILGSLLMVGAIKKSAKFLVVFLTSSILSALLLFHNFSLEGKLLIFSPFWFIHSMIDSPDRVGWLRLTLARETGFTQNNWLKYIIAETLSLLLFIIGNLGTRFFGVFSLIKFKTIFQSKEYFFLFVMSCLALVIPTLFIQAGNPWNTIQFIYYLLYISAVSGGLVLSSIFIRLSKLFTLPLIFIIGIITPINSWATANGYLYYKPHALITNKELEALEFLQSQSDGVILTYPYDKKLKLKYEEPWPLFVYDSTAYVGAFSNKALFLEDEGQNQILLTDYKKRLVASRDFFARSGIGEVDFLRKNDIKFIYIPKVSNVKLSSDIKDLAVIFENEEVIVYQVK